VIQRGNQQLYSHSWAQFSVIDDVHVLPGDLHRYIGDNILGPEANNIWFADIGVRHHSEGGLIHTGKIFLGKGDDVPCLPCKATKIWRRALPLVPGLKDDHNWKWCNVEVVSAARGVTRANRFERFADTAVGELLRTAAIPSTPVSDIVDFVVLAL